MTGTIEGGCRCDRVRFAATGRPLITMACHCTGCQRMTASAYSLSSLYRRDAFEVTRGETVIGGLHGATRHHFCAHCMSWLFTHPSGMPDFVNVRATLLDNAASYRPYIETHTREKLPWASTGAVHGYETFPPAERFSALLAGFAAWSQA